MKKLTILLALLFLSVTPAMADLLVPDFDDIINDLYMSGDSWGDDDTNPDTLQPSDEAAEAAWLESLLGPGYQVEFIYKFEEDKDGEAPYPINEIAIVDFDPGFDWLYAIVKVGNGQGGESHHAFYDNELDGVLSPDYQFAQAISHVTFFNATPVPEPATMLLFGMGLMGVAMTGAGRKKADS